jgi:hypothetical protein
MDRMVLTFIIWLDAARFLYGFGWMERTCGYAAHPTQDGLNWPLVFRIGEEDFADAAGFRTVVPAFEEG